MRRARLMMLVLSFRRGKQKVRGGLRSLRVAAELRLVIAPINYPKLVQLHSNAVVRKPGFFRNFAEPHSPSFPAFRLYNAFGFLLTQFPTQLRKEEGVPRSWEITSQGCPDPCPTYR
jgi:hypothetical protein